MINNNKYDSTFFYFTDQENLDGFLTIQNYILNCLDNNKKFFIGRLSGNEPNFVDKVINRLPIPEILLREMLISAGIQFTHIDDVKKYADEYNSAVLNSSLLGTWDGNMYLQANNYYNYLIYSKPNLSKVSAAGLEPYKFMNHPNYNFSTIFKNKKILIISSHKNTIEKQLKNINNIHTKNIFDKTSTFYVYKPPQQNGNSNDSNNWVYHFNKFKLDLDNINNNIFDFDIALVSSGGFGMIISNYIHTNLNKSVIYVGGALQLYFGINGNRWRQNHFINSIKNKYWTDVLDTDKPRNPMIVDGNCAYY